MEEILISTKELKSKIINSIKTIFSAIAFICISTIIILNSTFIYSYVVDKYKINEYTGLSSEVLMDNYKSIVYYLQNPFSKELVLKNFPMSEFGKIHFFEVKQIFMVIYLISIIYIGYIVYIKIKNNKSSDIIIAHFNKSVNIVAAILGIIALAIIIDFNKTFVVFHKIFFRNDYWIFDVKKDPVINALPEELFLILAAAIIGLLAIFFIIIKIIVFIRNHNKKFSK